MSVTYCGIQWIEIYPGDGAIHVVNNWDQVALTNFLELKTVDGELGQLR